MSESDGDSEDNGGGKENPNTVKIMEKIQLVGIKQHGIGYFPVSDNTKKGQFASQREVSNVIHSVYKMNSIDLTNFDKLVAIGNGMAVVKDKVVGCDAFECINRASWDCAVLARRLISKAGGSEREPFELGGKVIAVGMDFYHNFGFDVYNYYETFYCGILAILTGACGATFKAIFSSTTAYERYRRFNAPHVKAILDECELKPDANDELTLAAFSIKDGDPNTAKRKPPNSPGLPRKKRKTTNNNSV